MNAKVSARELLFGDAPPPLTGRGVRVVLFDSGIGSAPGLGERLTNLAQTQGEVEGSLSGNAHALRGAAICAEGEEANELQGGPVGIASEATVFSALHEHAFSAGLVSFMQQLVLQQGPIHVTAHAHSARDDLHSILEGRADLTLLGDADPSIRSVVIASAGHDAERGVRFPASAESAVAVGVCDESGKPTDYCSVSPEARKPELLVVDRHYAARLEDGSLGTLNGTSAATNVVAGIAALWCEWFIARELQPVPALVRAALFASSSPTANPAHRRIDSVAALSTDEVYAQYEDDTQGAYRFTLEVGASGKLSVAAVATLGERSRHWLPTLPRLTLRCAGNSGDVLEVTNESWSVLDLTALPGTKFSLSVTLKGPAEGLGLVAIGAAHVRKQMLDRPLPRADQTPVVVGISASHDASACVLRGGRIESAIQLERVTRLRRDGKGFLHSREAVDYCLHALGIQARQVDAFAFNAQPALPNYVGLSQPSSDADFDLFDPFSERSVFVSHHLAHAFSAFHTSPFAQAAVFVADGSGGSTLGADDLLMRGPEYREYLQQPLTKRPGLHVQSTYVFDPEGYRFVERELAESFNVRCGSSSLGEVYAAVSEYVFGEWQEGGKLMGLAPYGDPDRFGPSLLERDAEGRLQFRADWKDAHRRALRRGDPMELRHMAARVQRDLEDALVERVRRVVELTGRKDMAYAGGLALNGVANERLRRETGLQRLHVIPASNDAGISIGAAAAAHYLLTQSTAHTATKHDYLGYAYSARDCALAVNDFERRLVRAPLLITDVVDRLVAGKTVGVFEGASEFGPRALGHRSILADPRKKAMWEHVNRRIKFREDFRPFAPAVPVEVASEYFELEGDSPYMLRVVRVRDQYRDKLGAVTHVDGSARVQTVDRNISPRFHALLTEFGRRTGIPALMNTSLNVRGEPIVETPSDALEMLLSTHLDALVIGDEVVEPRPVDTLRRSDRLVLAPKTQAVTTVDSNGTHSAIIAHARGGRRYPLQPWVQQVLAGGAEGHDVGTLLDRHRPEAVAPSTALQLLESLCTLRLAAIERDGAAAGGKRTWHGLEALLSTADRAPYAPGEQRLRSGSELQLAVSELRHKLGVTRVADLTSYDYVGIPVASATRPSVDLRQITATQGKGLTLEDAKASALMEAVERHAGARARPGLLASVNALIASAREHASPSELGASWDPDQVIEWLPATSLASGRERLVPAASVLFPYFAPAGAQTPVRPATTGLASGSTHAEAVLHAIYEVVERDAVSQFLAGGPARYLRTDAIQSATEQNLVRRFEQAGVQLCIADLSATSAVAVYCVFTWALDGPMPSLLVAGQGAHSSPLLALRRALLEAAQSRVVALQGSREDLIRHASEWGNSATTTKAEFEALLAELEASPAATVPRAAEPARSVSDALEQVLSQLDAQGYHDVLYSDLQLEQIGIPVVRVTVPGMVDTVADPARRRRGAA